MCITESPCCTPESLQVNYTSIKYIHIFKKKDLCGGRAVHFRIFNQVPTSYSLDARSLLPKYVSKHGQIVFGGKIPPR